MSEMATQTNKDQLIVGGAYHSTTRDRTAIITRIGRSWAGHEIVRFDIYEQGVSELYRTNAKLTPAEFAAIYNRPVPTE